MNVAVLREVIKSTDKNWRFIFESPLYDKLEFVSGQLVQLAVEDPIEKGYYHKRNYSVASWADGTNRFELIITYIPGGQFSEYLFKEMQIGDEILYRGPVGIFTLPNLQKLDRDIFFVSTGSGISPFRSMMGWIGENSDKIETKNLKLFFGTRTEKEILYRDEMEALEKKLPNFEFIPTLSQENWGGKTGYVHEHYLKLIDEMDEKPLVYYCGWDKMIREGRSHLDARGFEMTKDIRVEIFG